MRGMLGAAATAVLVWTPLAAQDLAARLAAGDAARCRRNAEESALHYRTALAMDSMHYEANWKTSRALVDVALGLAEGQRARRDSIYAEARALAERAVRLNGTGADGHFMVAVAAGRAALTMGARERVRFSRVVRDEALRASELDTRHSGALHVLGRWNAEIERLPTMTKLFARTFLGAAIFNQATWEAAELYLTQAVNIDPQNIYHRLDLAEALVDMGKPRDAVRHLQEIARLPLGCDPQDAVYKRQAAALLERISRR